MRVLILSSGLGSINRGYERFLLELAEQLRVNGLPVTCWGSTEAPGVHRIPTLRRDELQQLALDRIRSDARLSSLSAPELHDWAMHTEEHLFAIAAAACLDEELCSKDPTIVYVKWQEGLVDPGGRSTALLERLARASREGPVCTIVRTDWVYRPIVERLAGHNFVFHSVTPWVTTQLRDMGVPPESIFELPNGVAGEPFYKARSRRAELRDEFNIPQDALVILSVGAFDHESKNFPFVLSEITTLAKDANVYWVVAGARGKEPTAWEQQARDIFGDRFRPLVGVQFEKMPDLYGLADLAVCGSLAETFGIVYAETQLSGLPFVMHDYEVTRWMTAGLPSELAGTSLVNMQAPGALSAAIAQWRAVLGNARARDALSTILERFRALQAKRFSSESLGPAFVEAFRAVATPEAARKRFRAYLRRIAADAHMRGVRLARQGKTADALPFLAAALRGEETSERWNDWASCQVACRRHDEAERAYRRAIELDAQNAEALANLSALLVNKKRHDEAIPFLERAIAIPDGKQHQLLQDLLARCRASGGTSSAPIAGDAVAPASRNLPPTGLLRILVIHETLPQTDCGGADVRLMQIVCALRAQGHAVTFVARLGLHRERYAPPLEALGVTIYANDAERLQFLGLDFKSNWSFDEVLKAGKFDVAILYHWFWTGPSVAEHYLPAIRRISPDTRIAVLSDDRHGSRELQMASLTKRLADVERGRNFQDREKEIYRQADLVLGITKEDFAEFLEATPDLQTHWLPMVADNCPPGPGAAKRKHLLFLGSFSNLANRDALEWFLDRVWPKIHQRLPGVEVHLAGSSMPDSFRKLGNGIVGMGHADDLARVHAQHRVFVSPVRYGTGIKTKNLAALAHGIPVVTTTIGAEGLNLRDNETVSIADDEDSFAEAVVRLYQNHDLWRRRAKAAREHILRQFSPEKLMAEVNRFIERVRSLRPKRIDPSFVASYQLVERFFPEVLTHLPGVERPGVRLVAYVHMGERFLKQGKTADALSQFRHAFHYLRGEIPNLSIFGRLLRGLERCYGELGDSESAERCARQRSQRSTDAREPMVELEDRGAVSGAATTLDANWHGSTIEKLSEALP
jgi:glycosyltransferase involved in cell wall biosynthesis